MRGDFSGLRQWQQKHYSSVRMQQGRVQLDVDWNDEVEILDYLSRTQSVDVIGPSGGPEAGGGFEITVAGSGADLAISNGRFYLDGILCEAGSGLTYATQPDLPGAPQLTNGKLSLADGVWLAYLDVWERAITGLDDPDLLEPALGGADTTIRERIVSQVKLLMVTPPAGGATCDASYPEWDSLKSPTPGLGRMAAHVGADVAGSRCTVESQLGFNGLENQLYRVEIHRGGPSGTATFKWSRENGSVAALVANVSGSKVTLQALPPLGIAKGDWIELCDDGTELGGGPGVLVRVSDATGAVLTLDETTLDLPPGVATLAAFLDPARVSGVIKARRWETSSPVATSAETTIGNVADTWIALENRVEVSFEPNQTYRSGDYWVVPARVAGGVVIWPLDAAKNPAKLLPAGVQHHYARLAVLMKSGASLTRLADCRVLFPPLTDIHADDVKLDPLGACALSPTVQDAISAIVTSESVDAVYLLRTSGQNALLPEGADVPADQLANGILVAGSNAIDLKAVTEAHCTVALELPFPVTKSDTDTWGSSILGHQAILLSGTVVSTANSATWTPSHQVANWLKTKFSAVEQFDESWTFFGSSGAANAGWAIGPQGELTQNGSLKPLVNGQDVFGFFAAHRDQMLGGSVVLRGQALAPASEGQPIASGLVYNYRDQNTFSVLMCQQTTGFGGSPTGGSFLYYYIDLYVFDVSHGLLSQRYIKRIYNGSALPQSQPFKMTVGLDGVTIEIGPSGSPTKLVDADQTVRLDLTGQRIGVYTSAPTSFWRLEEVGLPNTHVLIPAVYGARTRARLLLRRDGVRWQNCSTTLPTLRYLKDWETWFWVLPSIVGPYDSASYGSGSLGIGSENLL